MSVTEEIPETLIRESISRAVAHVFRITLARRTTLTFSGTQDPDDCGLPWPRAKSKEPHVIGSVGFHGAANGVVAFYLPLPLAHQCARAVLGVTDRELSELSDEGLNDAIGELAGIAAGKFSGELSDAGLPCTLTGPSIVRGNGFCADPGGFAHGQIYAFDCAGHRIVVDVAIQPAACAARFLPSQPGAPAGQLARA